MLNTPIFQKKHPYISTKDPYISTKEPHISTKEPYVSAWGPYSYVGVVARWTHPYVSTQELYVSTKVTSAVIVHSKLSSEVTFENVDLAARCAVHLQCTCGSFVKMWGSFVKM